MTDVYQKVREGHRFDLLERGFQSERGVRIVDLELKKQLNQERDKEDKECSSEEEDSNKKGRRPTGDIKKNAALLGRVSGFGYKVASQ